MKLVTFDNGRIGVVSDGRLVDVSDLAAVVPGAWPPVGMVRVRIQGRSAVRPEADLYSTPNSNERIVLIKSEIGRAHI